MTSSNWKDVAEVLGVVAIVLSLVFVGIQLQQDQEIAGAQAYIDAASQITELNQLISENKAIWVRGLDGEELSKEDEVVFQSIYHALFVRKIAQWQRAIRLSAGDPNSSIQDFAFDTEANGELAPPLFAEHRRAEHQNPPEVEAAPELGPDQASFDCLTKTDFVCDQDTVCA